MLIRISCRSYRTYSYAELMRITYLCLFRTPVGVTELIRIQNLYLYNRLIFYRDSHRSYRAYSYSEIPVGIKDQNDTPSFPLIHYSGYYHITMRIPRPVLINKEDTTQSVSEITIQYGSVVAQSRSVEALIRTGVP